MRKGLIIVGKKKVEARVYERQKTEWIEVHHIEDEFKLDKLPPFFKRVAQEAKKISFDLLIDRDQVLAGLLELPKETHLGAAEVREKGSKLLGNQLGGQLFDFKWIESTEKTVWVQYLGLKEEFETALVKSLQESGVKVGRIETEASSLASLFGLEEKPVLGVTKDLAVACFQTNVFVWASFSTAKEKEKVVKAVKNEVEARWGIELEVKEAASFDPALQLLQGAVSPKKARLKPLKLALKPQEKRPVAKPAEKKKSNKGWLLIVLGLVLVVGGVGAYLLLAPKEEVDPEPVITEEPEPAPVEEEPAEVVVEELEKNIKIKVLNGSGAAGVAGGGRDFLSARGFENIEVGNAGKYDYLTTLVDYKKELEPVIDQLVDLLKEDYKAELDEVLDEESEFDAVITIGLE